MDRGRLVALDTPAGLRRAVAREVRFSTLPPVGREAASAALGEVDVENDGTLVWHVEPTPERIAQLSSWLVAQGALLTELRAGSRSLEQAFLSLTDPV
jgi:ABC-2 type transport system ATP-binding protein